MAQKLEFHDDFSLRDIFGMKKKGDAKTSKTETFIPNDNRNLLPPETRNQEGETYQNSHTRYGAFTDLKHPLITFSPSEVWTLADAVRGVQIFGGIGSGKSSGSGKLLALTFLKNGFGGLVLCGKPDERANWEEYAKFYNREDDLIIFDKKSKFEFNPLIYELTRESEGAGDTSNMVNLFISIYKLGKRINGSEAKSSDSFWENALRRLLSRTIDLLKLANEELSIDNIVSVVSSAPFGMNFLEHIETLKSQNPVQQLETEEDEDDEDYYDEEEGEEEEDDDELQEQQTEDDETKEEPIDLVKQWYRSEISTCTIWVANQYLELERKQLKNEEKLLNHREKVDNIELSEERVELENRKELYEEKRELFNKLKNYFLKELATLAPETHSSLLETFYGITEPFTTGILKRQFSSGLDEDVKPEVTFNSEDGRGKIIILDFPVKNYLEAGIFAQGIYKLMWQQTVERRVIKRGDSAIPVFLWVDESQFFVSEYDMLFQTTARSSRACTVFLTQNISNYYAMMGGENAKSRVDSLLGNLSTKIFHANNDYVTNEWAANTIGKVFRDINNSNFSLQVSKQGGASISGGEAEQLHYQVQPKDFTTLKCGDEENDYIVEGYLITVGKDWINTDGERENFKLVKINQLSNVV